MLKYENVAIKCPNYFTNLIFLQYKNPTFSEIVMVKHTLIYNDISPFSITNAFREMSLRLTCLSV